MTIFGIAGTLIYILMIIILRWASFPELKTMPLNEFGDFFAGVFGPLMLFWLILGYIQQQNELRQNTKALELQADELRRSVEQHKELVATTKEQLQADLKALEIEEIKSIRESLPTFTIKNAGWVSRSGERVAFEISIVNSGQPASSITFNTIPSINNITPSGIIQYVGAGDTFKINWDTITSGEPPKELKLIINCRNANARAYTKQFDFVLDGENNYHVDQISEVA